MAHKTGDDRLFTGSIHPEGMRIATQVARAIGIFDRDLGLANPSKALDGVWLGQRNTTGFIRQKSAPLGRGADQAGRRVHLVP